VEKEIKMEEKYKIYSVWIKQTFNVYSYEWKWFKRYKKTRIETVEDNEEYIMAKSKEEAIRLYKERYVWDYNECICCCWDLLHDFTYKAKEPNYQNIIMAYEIHPTFEELKAKLRGDDFLAYCKQEMYPIEILMRK
jgi:hypothetical protein